MSDTVEQRDYPEFDDKIITYVDEDLNKGVPFKARVVGCSFDVGVTLVYSDNPKKYLLCYHGFSSPRMKIASDGFKEKYKDSWPVLFEWFVKSIADGFISMQEEPPVHGSQIVDTLRAGAVGASSCAFGA
jgi:hypothetical protein